MTTRAGDVVERLKQLSVESACFDFLSVLYFDLSFIEDSTDKNTLEVEHYVGRFVKGKEQALRCDVLYIGDPESGREPEMQHFLSLPNGERLVAFKTVSSGFDKVKLDPRHSSPHFVSRCNPFRCAVRGRAEFGSGREYDLFQTLFANFEEFEENPNTLRGNSGGVVKKFQFDREIEWQINSCWTYMPKGNYERLKRFREKRKLKSIDEIKDWTCVSEIETF